MQLVPRPGSRRTRASLPLMVWLSTPIAVVLVWFIVVVLFTPGVNYHLRRRTAVLDAGFLYPIRR